MASLSEFSNFVLSEMEDRLKVDAVYTIQTFNRVNHGLLLGTLARKFRRPMIFGWVLI
jgi:hypothetical protein